MHDDEERLYFIYEETREGMKYVHDTHAKNPDKALEKAVSEGYIESGARFTVIADSNIHERTS